MAYSGAWQRHGGPQRQSAPQPVYRDEKTPPPGLTGPLEAVLKKLGKLELETDDLLLALVLYLLYRQSGDKQLLVVLGVMLLS